MINPLFTDEEIEGNKIGKYISRVAFVMIEANKRHSKIIEGIIKEIEELELWEYNDINTRINKLSKIYEKLK